MTESYGFFASAEGDIRQYSQTPFSKMLRSLVRTGVHHAFGGALQVNASVPAGLSVTVSPGFAFVEGFWYDSDAAKTLPLAAPHISSPRIDRVVLQLDRLAERWIKTLVLTGVPAATPTPPALTRENAVYELALADVLVPAGASVAGAITDRRMDPDLCGFAETWLATERAFYPFTTVQMNGQTLANLGSPSADTDAATKEYVDNAVAGGGWSENYLGFYAGDMIDMAGHMGQLDDLGASPNGRHVYARGSPPQWLLCNGAEVRKADYPDLWAALDDGAAGHYGSPSGGSNYFKLPQLTGNVAGYYYPGGGVFGTIGSINPSSGVHATPGTGAQNVPQWQVVGGKLIKT